MDNTVSQLNQAVVAGLTQLRAFEKDTGRVYRMRFYQAPDGTLALDVEPDPESGASGGGSPESESGKTAADGVAD